MFPIAAVGLRSVVFVTFFFTSETLPPICDRPSASSLGVAQLQDLPTGRQVNDQEDLHYLTCATVGWVDVFTRTTYKDILVESLRFCQQAKGLELFAWCIMSNHIHLIAGAAPGHKLQDILRYHKKFTAKAFVKAIEENAQESRQEWLLAHLRNSDVGIQL